MPPERPKRSETCRCNLGGSRLLSVALEVGSAAEGCIGLYCGDAGLLRDSLEYVQQTVIQILNTIGADESSAPWSFYICQPERRAPHRTSGQDGPGLFSA